MTQRNTFDGVSPNQEKVTLEGGGERSATPYRFQDLPPLALAEVARRFGYGVNVRGYPVNNWRKLPFDNFINHGLAHVFADIAGDEQDEHLVSAAWNFLCALEIRLVEKTKPVIESKNYTTGVDMAAEGGDYTVVIDSEEQIRINAAKSIRELLHNRKDLDYNESTKEFEYILLLLEQRSAQAEHEQKHIEARLKQTEEEAEKRSKQIFLLPRFCPWCSFATTNRIPLSANEAEMPCYCNKCGYNLKPHFSVFTPKGV